MKLRFSSELLCKRNPHHVRRLDAWVKARWPDVPETWEQFLRRLPGFYPLDVVHSLERLGLPSEFLSPTSYRISSSSPREAFPDVLEHPLDYEWRFAGQSVGSVLDKIRDFAKENSRPSIVCLGCPSIAVGGEDAFPSWRWTLLDRRAELLRTRISNVRLEACDLTLDHPDLPMSDAAVVDPPWYMPITKHFLLRAQALTKQGGIVLLSSPPEGTRPKAKDDLIELLEWCNAGGLEPVQVNYGHLFYRTPFFEWNSLKAAGFSARVPAWRRADLLVFVNKCGSACRLRYDEAVPKKFSGSWRQYARDGLKFCVSVSGNDEAQSTRHDSRSILPVWTEAVLPTVSTSFPGRDGANLVTSGNRFLRCADPASISTILEGWVRGEPLSASQSLDASMSTTLASIISDELADRDEYLKHTYD